MPGPSVCCSKLNPTLDANYCSSLNARRNKRLYRPQTRQRNISFRFNALLSTSLVICKQFVQNKVRNRQKIEEISYEIWSVRIRNFNRKSDNDFTNPDNHIAINTNSCRLSVIGDVFFKRNCSSFWFVCS